MTTPDLLTDAPAVREEGAQTPLVAALAWGTLVAVLFVLFSIWNASSAWAFPIFLVAVALFVYAPGLAVLRLARIRLVGLERFAIAVAVGAATTMFVSWILAALGARTVLVALPVASILILTRRATSAATLQVRRSDSRTHVWLALLSGLILVPAFSIGLFFRNFTRSSGMLTATLFPDQILHAGIAHDLAVAFPPQIFAANSGAYHYFMDLLASALSWVVPISRVDVVVRFLPALFLVECVIVTFCCARAWLKSTSGAFLVSFLVLFGENLSYIFGIASGSTPWVESFPLLATTTGIYWLNPMLPATALIFAAVFCYQRFEERTPGSWLVPSSLLVGAAFGTKIFFGVILLGAVWIAGAVIYAKTRSTRWLGASLAASVATGPVAVHYLVLMIGGASTQEVALHPFPFHPTIEESLIEVLPKIGAIDSSLARPALMLLFGPVLIVATLGARVIGLGPLRRSLEGPEPPNGARIAVAAALVLGVLTSLTVTLSSQAAYDNSIWIAAPGLLIAWLFTGEGFLSLTKRVPAWARIAGVVALIGISVPSSLQFLWIVQQGSLQMVRHVRPSTVEALNQLGNRCKEGRTALAVPGAATLRASRPDEILGVDSLSTMDAQVVSIAGCRVPVFAFYWELTLFTPQEFERRRGEVERFRRNWRRGNVARDVIDRYDVAWVMDEHGARERSPRCPDAVSYRSRDFTIYRADELNRCSRALRS